MGRCEIYKGGSLSYIGGCLAYTGGGQFYKGGDEIYTGGYGFYIGGSYGNWLFLIVLHGKGDFDAGELLFAPFLREYFTTVNTAEGAQRTPFFVWGWFPTKTRRTRIFFTQTCLPAFAKLLWSKAGRPAHYLSAEDMITGCCFLLDSLHGKYPDVWFVETGTRA